MPPRALELLRGGRLEDVHGAGRAQPDDVGQAHLGPLDLTVAGLAPEVRGHLVEVGDAGGPDGVALGDEPARHVDRRRPVAPGAPPVDEVAGPARLAQREVLVVDELGGGEAVVQLDEVEVLGRHPGLLVGGRGGLLGQGVDVGLGLVGLDVGVRGQHRGRDLHRPSPDVGVEGLELGVGAQDHAAAPSPVGQHMSRVFG